VVPALLGEFDRSVRTGNLDAAFAVTSVLRDDAVVPLLSFVPLWESFRRAYNGWKTVAKRKPLPHRTDNDDPHYLLLRQLAQAFAQAPLSLRRARVLRAFIQTEDTFIATHDNFVWFEDVRDIEGTGLLGDLLDALFSWRRDLAESYVLKRLPERLAAALRTQLVRAVGWWFVTDAVPWLKHYLRVPVYDPRCDVITIDTLGTIQQALSIPARLARSRGISEWALEPQAVILNDDDETPQYIVGLSPWRASLYALCRLGQPGTVDLVLSKLRETLGPERSGGIGDFQGDLLTILGDARLRTRPVHRVFAQLITRSSKSIAAGGPLLVWTDELARAMVVCGVFPKRAVAAALHRLLTARKRHAAKHKRERAGLMLRRLLAAALLLSPRPQRSGPWRVFLDYARFLRRSPNVIDLLKERCGGWSMLELALDRPSTIERLLQPLAVARDRPARLLLEKYDGRPRLAEYQIERFLGEGATKAAWLAHLNVPGVPRKLFVLKLFREPDLERVFRQFGYSRRVLLEAEVSGSPSTHLSVPMLRQDEHGRRCFVEEFFGGGTLDRAVETWPHANRLRFLVSAIGDVCSGLRDLHDQHRVHCDLKLDNIGIRDDGHAVVIDLGNSIDISRPYRYLVNPGSPRTRAPELFGRGVSPTVRSDIWSLGCSIFALVTGGKAYPYVGVRQDLGSPLQRSAWERDLSASLRQKSAQVDFDRLIDKTLRAARMEVLTPVLTGCLRIDARKRAEDVKAIQAMLRPLR
jgi:tRNA A-37 threonylcarbamoyl transferase component Bud32